MAAELEPLLVAYQDGLNRPPDELRLLAACLQQLGLFAVTLTTRRIFAGGMGQDIRHHYYVTDRRQVQLAIRALPGRLQARFAAQPGARKEAR